MNPATTRSVNVNSTTQLAYAPFLLLGFLIWFSATLVFRWAGHLFFITDNTLFMSLNFLALTIAMPLLMYKLYALRQLSSSQRAIAAICVMLLGMLLDALSVYFFEQVFPNLPASAGRPFGAWLLWGYGISLLTALIPRSEQA